jgi:uncharacterized protein (DUF362 family)
MRNLTRRQFLQTAAGASAAAALELSRLADWPSTPTSIALADDWPAVSIGKGTNADSTTAILKTALDGLGGIEQFVKPGMTVAIKPNATWAYPPFTASSTDPEMLRSLITMVRQAGAKRVIVMDHCSIDPGTAECLRESGIGDVVDQLKVDKVFPDRYLAPKEVYTQIDLPKGKAFKKVGVIKAAVEADLRINLALPKSHVVTKLTLVLKHMMGFLEVPSGLHANLEQGIADISTVSPMQAQLHILEAIRVRLPTGPTRQAGGYETDVTHPNKVKRHNEILAGTDPVLMDAYGCVKYFAFKPQELTHIKLAADMGLGEMDVDKATQARRLRVYIVGQPVATPTPAPTKPAATVPSTSTGVPPTSTPLPTSTPGPIEVAAVPSEAIAERSCANTTDVINPSPFLSSALIPAAAIVAGVGIVARKRLERKEQERDDDE